MKAMPYGKAPPTHRTVNTRPTGRCKNASASSGDINCPNIGKFSWKNAKTSSLVVKLESGFCWGSKRIIPSRRSPPPILESGGLLFFLVPEARAETCGLAIHPLNEGRDAARKARRYTFLDAINNERVAVRLDPLR
jgi:hypothetical protein